MGGSMKEPVRGSGEFHGGPYRKESFVGEGEGDWNGPQ